MTKNVIASIVEEVIKHLPTRHNQEKHAGERKTRPSLRVINKKIFPDELVKGNGYFYFNFDDNESRFSTSVAVNKISDMTTQEWLDEYGRIKRETEDYLDERAGKKFFGGAEYGE